jgi:hypothetical protein
MKMTSTPGHASPQIPFPIFSRALTRWKARGSTPVGEATPGDADGEIAADGLILNASEGGLSGTEEVTVVRSVDPGLLVEDPTVIRAY